MALNFKKKQPAGAAGSDDAGPKRHEWPSPIKPSALLVPRYVVENNAAAATRRTSVLVVGVIAVVMTLAVSVVSIMAMTSKQALTEAQGARDAAQVNVDRLGPIANYYDGLEQRRSTAASLLSGDVAHAKLLRSFHGAIPPGVTYQSYNPLVGQACPGPDPFNVPNGLGCITAQMTAQNAGQISALVSRLQATDKTLFSDPFVSELNTRPAAQGGGRETTFTLSVNFSPDAYSNRYADPSGALTDLPPSDPATPESPTTEDGPQ